MKKFFALAFVMVVAVLPLAFVSGCGPQFHSFERQVFDLTNIERENYGLPPLIWHNTLAIAARDHAIDLEQNNIRGHVGSDGSTVRERIEREGLTGMRGWSENAAYGQRTPEAVVAAWMNSPGHRANILRENSTHLGVGFHERPEGSTAQFATYWVQKFVNMG